MILLGLCNEEKGTKIFQNLEMKNGEIGKNYWKGWMACPGKLNQRRSNMFPHADHRSSFYNHQDHSHTHIDTNTLI